MKRFTLSMDLSKVQNPARVVALVLRQMAEDLDRHSLAEAGKLWLHDGEEYGCWEVSDDN